MKIVERVTLHSPSRLKVGISDDTGRITMLENRTFGTQANDNDTAPSLTRYIYSNHLQSASLELNQLAEIISYEEYHPYGTTSYQAINAAIQAVAKRYRYTGKERDEESGLYYHGARYYIPWLCRWVSVDPINNDWYNLANAQPGRNLKRTHTELSASSYEYAYDNPIVYSDPSGEQPPPQKSEIGTDFKYKAPPVVDNARDVRSNPITVSEAKVKHPYSLGQYIVREDDTLSAISEKLGVSIPDLAKMNDIKDINKLQIGQILDVAPERNFSKNPRGGYRNPNNAVGVEYTVDNMFSAGAQFFYGLGSENEIIVAGKSLDAIKKWDKVQSLLNKGITQLWKDGKLTPGETFADKYAAPTLFEYTKRSIKGEEEFWTPIHVIGSFGFSMRVNADGQTATVAVYDSKTISSLSDNKLGQSANIKNTSSTGRNYLTTQYIRFIWKTYLVK